MIFSKDTLDLIPNYSPYYEAYNYYFDEIEAQKILDFFRLHLKFVRGEKAGQYFKLEKWQQAIILNLLCWKNKDTNYRRYRETFILIPRKNGKTKMIAGLLTYLAFCAGEPGAQIYSAAASREQASLIYSDMAEMIERNPSLLSRSNLLKAYKKIEIQSKEKCIFKSLSSEGKVLHGLDISVLAVDEMHCIDDREYLAALTTAQGARRNPLTIYISTSGVYRPESPCYEKYDYACKVLDKVISDNSFLPVVYEAQKEDDWTDEKTWRKVNPNLGVSVSLDYLQKKCEEAKQIKSEENNFKRLFLNIWTQQLDRWISIDKWNEAPQKEVAAKDLVWFAGLDLSSVSDLTAFVLCAQDKEGYIHTRTYPFIPEENSYLRSLKDKVPYDTWAKEGFIELTNGNCIDYDYIRKRINEIGKEYNIKEIAVDRWNASQIITQLQSDGFEIVPFGQGFASMSSPSKYLEQLIASKKLVHNFHPVLTWCASNVSIEQDAAENIKPSKDKSTERIDCLVALIMGLGRLISTDTTPQKSVYEDRGVLVF